MSFFGIQRSSSWVRFHLYIEIYLKCQAKLVLVVILTISISFHLLLANVSPSNQYEYGMHIILSSKWHQSLADHPSRTKKCKIYTQSSLFLPNHDVKIKKKLLKRWMLFPSEIFFAYLFDQLEN